MMTPAQEQWIAHLSDEKIIQIFPFDETAGEKFQKIKRRIQGEVGQEFVVEHHGATRFGISGQDEIDVYVPVQASSFNTTVQKFSAAFGKPRSLYDLERARFIAEVDGKHIDLFVVNKEHPDWAIHVKFEDYLLSHPDALKEYEELKEGGNGLSVRDYYRRKVEFINSVLERT